MHSPPSKLKPPALGTPFMARNRLIERIRQASEAKLILVQAPAGFGKTTLLRHLYDSFSAEDYAIAWLTLDAGDNDLDRFIAYLHQAFAKMHETAPSPSAALPAHMQLSLIDENCFEPALALASIPRSFMLILDGCEHVHNPAALSLIQQMIDMLEPHQKIAIGSREQPMLNAGRLRAHQQLLEIDAAQLRFNVEETTEFLCNKRALKLDNHDIEHLQRITDGWAAAVWLSSLALEDNNDPKRFIQTFSGSHTVVASYLAEDVLSHRPKQLQDFILQTSILQKFCADSCNAVTGRTDSRELLQQIERSNMFMTALDEQRTWFSYHPLFSGFLRAQLERQYPGLAATLHRRAAAWYIEQQRPTHAIDHARAAGDKHLMGELLNLHAEPLFLQGRVRLLTRWFDKLDHASIIAYPKLISVYAWSLIHINRSAEALTLLENSSSSVSQLTYHVLRLFSLVMLDRIDETAPMWDDPTILESAAQEPLLRSMLMFGCAYYYTVIGRYRDARQLLDQATQKHSTVGPLFSVSVAGYMHGMLDLLQGRLRAAEARLRTVIGNDSLRQHNRSSANSGFARIYLAEVLYETDALDEAKRLLKLYLPLVKDAGIPCQLISSHVIYARILRAAGNVNDALQILLELEQLGMQRNLPRIIDMARLEQARMSILDGDFDAAKNLLTLAESAPSWQRDNLQMIAGDIETPLLGAMRLQVHCGQAAATLAILKEHLQDAQHRGRQRYALRVKILYALALFRAGQRNPALRTIRETLQEAQIEGFVRIFKDEGPALLTLIHDMQDSMKDVSCPEHRNLHSFVEKILGNLKTTHSIVNDMHHGAEAN